MKTITMEMLDAVKARRNWKKSNTEVKTTGNGKNVFVYLFDNCIYAKVGKCKYYSDCGWKTQTTADRLNALGASYSWSKKAQNKGLTRKDLHKLYINTLFGL